MYLLKKKRARRGEVYVYARGMRWRQFSTQAINLTHAHRLVSPGLRVRHALAGLHGDLL